jgi:hypothetical protein
MKRLPAAIIAALATLALILLGLLPVIGCTSAITGGSTRKVDEHANTTTGATAAENRNTVVIVSPAGAVEVRSGTAAATTQPTHTETARTETATTQPSARSTTGLPKLDADGGISIEPNAVAERYKAVLPVVIALIVIAVLFWFFGSKVGAVACVGLAVAAAWIPGVVAWASLIGVIGWLILHNWAQVQQLVHGNERALASLPADLADKVKGKMAEAHDVSLKRVIRRVTGKVT